MLETKISGKNRISVYEPSNKELNSLYGKISLYSAEKKFAFAKCCMCCR